MLFVESIYWMSLCLYHEARGEPQEGQTAIAHVIMTRAVQRSISAKAVINQKAQFSWLWDDLPDDVRDHAAFIRCMQSVITAQNQRMEGFNLSGANHYHATYMTPYWAKDMTRVGQIGKHIFYRSK